MKFKNVESPSSLVNSEMLTTLSSDSGKEYVQLFPETAVSNKFRNQVLTGACCRLYIGCVKKTPAYWQLYVHRKSNMLFNEFIEVKIIVIK